MLLILGFEIDPIGRIMTDTHLIYHRGDSEHLPIRILCLDIDFPDISVISFIYSKGMGNDWGMSPWLGLSPSVRKQLSPSFTREEKG
jgi:hypothetical protein